MLATTTPVILNVAASSDGMYVFLGAVVGAVIGVVIATIQIRSQSRLAKSQRLFEVRSKAYRDFFALITKTHEERRMGVWFPDMSKEEDRKKLHDHITSVLLFSNKPLTDKIYELTTLFKVRPPSLVDQFKPENVAADKKMLAVIQNIMTEMRRELELDDLTA